MGGDAEHLAKGLHPLERAVLPHLQAAGRLQELAATSKLQEVEAMRALQWLEGKGCVTISTAEEERLLIKEKGKAAAKEGLPESAALDAIKKAGALPVAELAKALPEYDKGAVGPVTGALKRMGLPFIKDENGRPGFKWVEGLDLAPPASMATLKRASKNGWELPIEKQDEGIRDLLKRQGYAELQKKKIKKYSLTRLGRELQKAKGATQEYAERLTPEMLKRGAWQELEFRPYNVTINVPATSGGRAHFVNEAIAYIKQIWLDFGFEEMTGDHVQSAFWDLDALFVPQDHPAREMQDTFYLETPEKARLPRELYKRVKAVHEDGGDTGSLGWRTPYSEEKAQQNMLRTHTTVLSAQTLDKIRKGEKPLPGKYFSVSSVYRNEALDWKHLFEFLQVEGIVVGKEATFANLKGYLKAFFERMGFPDIRIRPGHFPYTEPSAEVDVWDPRKEEWVELGGSGIFRPEVTKTLLGEEVPVLAWGLGMERIITRYYNIKDLREIYANDLEQLKSVKAWLK